MSFVAKTIATSIIVSALAAAPWAQAAGASKAIRPNPAAGGATFEAKCSGCHTDIKGRNGVGPSLFGVYGRTAGTAAGYSYSRFLKASGIVWSNDRLTAWLTRPSALVPGTKMGYVPPMTAEEKVNLIAYLKSKK